MGESVPQDTKRDAARRELLRLLKGLEFYRAWRISGIKRARGHVQQEDLNEIVLPSASFIRDFDAAAGQYSHILQVVQQWYSHTYLDLCYRMYTGGEDLSSDIRQFLEDFRNEAGFEFQSEAGLVSKTIRKVLKRGKITTASDYFILKELENCVDQPGLEDSEFAVVSSLLRQFENR
ncbi:hypothetical protein J7400_00875 [Shimia sp. R9_2]|nr:hypothetical protein [Shimia sp. R9_2]